MVVLKPITNSKNKIKLNCNKYQTSKAKIKLFLKIQLVKLIILKNYNKMLKIIMRKTQMTLLTIIGMTKL